MTRDEATPIARQLISILDASKDHASARADALLAALECLGMLKLDESEDDRLALSASFAFDTDKKEMALFRERLRLFGLKVVSAK